MIHETTWLGRTRAGRGARKAAPLVFVLGCVLLALAGFASAASASAPEMRGEWEIVLKAGGQTNMGTTIIRQEANAQGEFASEAVQLAQGSPGTFTGTLEGATATVKITASPANGVPASEFNSATMTVTSGVGTLEISGEGTFAVPSLGMTAPGTVVAKRIKTYQEVQEREARELREREEKEAREAIRGEWALTLEDGPVVVKEIALISEQANSKNEFRAKSVMVEGKPAGTFTGTLKGAEADVTLTTNEVPGQLPPGTFQSSAIAVSSKSNPTSMTGSGELSFEGGYPPPSTATLTATRVRSYQQVQAQEAKERAEEEEKEKQAEEAQVAKEKAEQLAKETAERETRERREREAHEALEKFNKAIVPPPVEAPKPTLISVALAPKTLKGVTVGHGHTVSLALSNPNHLTVGGQLDMFTATSGSTSTKKKITQFGTASFTLTASGATVVKLKLSSANYATLLHRRRLRVVVNVTTTADGVSTPTKSYGVTLSATPTAKRKH
ncbi:MAG: hypothetical protein WB998_00100 [Solirubrobacteraceae bacterium]